MASLSCSSTVGKGQRNRNRRHGHGLNINVWRGDGDAETFAHTCPHCLCKRVEHVGLMELLQLVGDQAVDLESLMLVDPDDVATYWFCPVCKNGGVIMIPVDLDAMLAGVADRRAEWTGGGGSPPSTGRRHDDGHRTAS